MKKVKQYSTIHTTQNRRGWYVSDVDSIGRGNRPSHEVIRLNHTGWYCDTYNDETSHGLVITLPHGKFLSGRTDVSGGVFINHELFSDEESAARDGDCTARIYAEREQAHAQEYDNACDLAREISDKKSSICMLRAIRLIDRSKHNVQGKISDLIREIRKLRQELQATNWPELEGDY